MKWNIPKPPSTLDAVARKQYWEKTHADEYGSTVWSMTEDPDVQDKICTEVAQIRAKDLWIPGCGSRVCLQNAIAGALGDARILCTDYPGVVDIAMRAKNAPQIRYEALDTANSAFDNQFDAVIVVNSILSEDDEENRRMLAACRQALRPGGKMLGFFPTVFATLDIASIERDSDRAGLVDLATSSLYEEKQGVRQIFYTPLRLRLVLREAGFGIDRMEVFFCDSAWFLEQSRIHYGLQDPDCVIYEHFVSATSSVSD